MKSISLHPKARKIVATGQNNLPAWRINELVMEPISQTAAAVPLESPSPIAGLKVQPIFMNNILNGLFTHGATASTIMSHDPISSSSESAMFSTIETTAATTAQQTSTLNGSSQETIEVPKSVLSGETLAGTSSESGVVALPKGIFNDPDNDIIEDSPEIRDGVTIPRVLVPENIWAEAVETDTWCGTFCVPASLSGVLIGRQGKNVRELKRQWNADFSLNMSPDRQDILLLKLSCPMKHKERVLHWIVTRSKTRTSQTTIGDPNQLLRSLPLGQLTPILVRSLYGMKEMYLTVLDTEYSRYLSMQKELNQDYGHLNHPRMYLYEPVTSGTVAVLSHRYGFARVLILKVLQMYPRRVVCFLLDYGTYGVVSLVELRKIKAKYIHVPFQAVNVSWAHAAPMCPSVPDLYAKGLFFEMDRIFVYPVRMRTCCQASVVLLEYHEVNETPVYNDLLARACDWGFCGTASLTMFRGRQTWLNRTDTPYYVCPYSQIDYGQLVRYFPDPDSPEWQLQEQNQSDPNQPPD